MSADIEKTLRILANLYDVWKLIETEVDDGEDKFAAQKIIDNLIISTAQDLVEAYRNNKKKIV